MCPRTTIRRFASIDGYWRIFASLAIEETKTVPLYELLPPQAVLAVKAEAMATFLGKKITSQRAQEIGNRFTTRIEGTCIKQKKQHVSDTISGSLPQTVYGIELLGRRVAVLDRELGTAI